MYPPPDRPLGWTTPSTSPQSWVPGPPSHHPHGTLLTETDAGGKGVPGLDGAESQNRIFKAYHQWNSLIREEPGMRRWGVGGAA